MPDVFDTDVAVAWYMEEVFSAYDAVYISLCLSRDVPLITAEKTTTAWVTKLRNRIESVR